MEVTTTQKSVKGPAQMFTGDVWFDVIAKGNDPSRLRANAVRFAPCARTAWYRRARASGRGRIRAGGVERDVAFGARARDNESSTRLSARCLRWQRAW